MIRFNDKLTPFLKRMESIQWFSNCGNASSYDGITPVRSWAEARKYYKNLKWEKFITAVSNRETEMLWEEGYREDELNKRGHEVLNSVSHVLSTLPIFERVEADDALRWKVELDLRIILSEVNASDLVKPLIAIPLVWPWYERGHLPCGWDGKMISQDWAGNGPDDLPEGRLRVY